MRKLATVLQAILGLMFLFSGISKLTGSTDDMRVDLEIASWFWTMTGVFEIAGAIALLVSLRLAWLAAPAALWFAVLFTGAIIAHLRVGDSLTMLIGPAVLLILSLVILSVRWNLFAMPDSDSARHPG